MKIKRGAEVRIRRTNQIVTINDIELIRKHGQVHKYCQLKQGKKPDLWMDAQELGEIIERVTINITNHDNGQQVRFELKNDHKKEELRVKCSAIRPESLCEQNGLHAHVSELLILALKKDAANS